MKKEWWHDKVAYQIYPKSFCDSNGDGIGDINGIRSKLDILKDLGIDIIWISPCYKSPFADEGYDISDYCDIDPKFGTLEELDQLIAEAKARDMSVIMDLVVNHCSDEHIWFKRACADPEGPYGKYFYILPYQDGDPLPTNWRSYFGGPVWDKLPGHDDYVYLHVFHKKQPDLNWENPDVRNAIYDMMNWWLDRGIAGFRIDAIINIKKALPFRSYPADHPDGLCAIQTMLKNADGVLDFFNEMAEKTFRPHHAFAIAELFDYKEQDFPRFFGDDGCFSSIFDFAPACINQAPEGWYSCKKVTLEQYRDTCFASQIKASPIGFMANIIENHDEPRGVSHFLPDGEHSDEAKKMLGGISFMLRGLPFLYQGQELGMENIPFSKLSDVSDCSTLGQYQLAIDAGLSPKDALAAVAPMSRDNARTPYQWSDADNAGFTIGAPWMRINPNYKTINYESQEQNPNSVWHFYRSLAAIRHNPAFSETIVYGITKPWMEETPGLMAFYRQGPDTLLVIANLEPISKTLTLPKADYTLLLSNGNCTLLKDSIQLDRYGFAVLNVTTES